MKQPTPHSSSPDIKPSNCFVPFVKDRSALSACTATQLPPQPAPPPHYSLSTDFLSTDIKPSNCFVSFEEHTSAQPTADEQSGIDGATTKQPAADRLIVPAHSATVADPMHAEDFENHR